VLAVYKLRTLLNNCYLVKFSFIKIILFSKCNLCLFQETFYCTAEFLSKRLYFGPERFDIAVTNQAILDCIQVPIYFSQTVKIVYVLNCETLYPLYGVKFYM
jgi:hypothetical protein